MADLLKGDTIHHACGIPVWKKGTDGEMVVQSHKAVAEQSLYWRWLIIDEFGMVGSSLPAEVDMKLRDVIVDVNPHKKNIGGHSYPFGGLNVLLSGDLWQLPPPSGGFVGNIPAEFICNSRKYNSYVTISHGQSLLWGGVTTQTGRSTGSLSWRRASAAEKTPGCKKCNWSCEKADYPRIATPSTTERQPQSRAAGSTEWLSAATLGARERVKKSKVGRRSKHVREHVSAAQILARGVREWQRTLQIPDSPRRNLWTLQLSSPTTTSSTT